MKKAAFVFTDISFEGAYAHENKEFFSEVLEQLYKERHDIEDVVARELDDFLIRNGCSLDNPNIGYYLEQAFIGGEHIYIDFDVAITLQRFDIITPRIFIGRTGLGLALLDLINPPTDEFAFVVKHREFGGNELTDAHLLLHLESCNYNDAHELIDKLTTPKQNNTANISHPSRLDKYKK